MNGCSTCGLVFLKHNIIALFPEEIENVVENHIFADGPVYANKLLSYIWPLFSIGPRS